MTTTREFIPSDTNLIDNAENIYNLQKYRNGYIRSNNYNDKFSSRRFQKQKPNVTTYGTTNPPYETFRSDLVVNGNTHRDEYFGKKLSDLEGRGYGVGVEGGVRGVSYKNSEPAGVIEEDTLIDVIEDLQLHGEGDDVESRPGILRTRHEATQRTYR